MLRILIEEEKNIIEWEAQDDGTFVRTDSLAGGQRSRTVQTRKQMEQQVNAEVIRRSRAWGLQKKKERDEKHNKEVSDDGGSEGGGRSS